MGRPPKNPNAKPLTTAQKEATAQKRHGKRVDLLQDTMEDLCIRIHDGNRGFTSRAVSSRSVDLKVKLAALQAIREACNDSEAAIRAAAGTVETERTARVNLAEL